MLLHISTYKVSELLFKYNVGCCIQIRVDLWGRNAEGELEESKKQMWTIKGHRIIKWRIRKIWNGQSTWCIRRKLSNAKVTYLFYYQKNTQTYVCMFICFCLYIVQFTCMLIHAMVWYYTYTELVNSFSFTL